MSYPQRLLGNICWTNSTERYPNREKFEKEVRTHQHDILETDEGWRPEELALEHPSVQIQFRCWIGQEEAEPSFELNADDGKSFTTLELFHKVCDGIAQTLIQYNGQLYDHCFFEGLSLSSQHTKPPLYFVYFGS